MKKQQEKTQTTQQEKQPEKLGYWARRKIKKFIKITKKEIQKEQQKHKEKTEIKNKTKLIEIIQQLQEVFEITEDNETTPITKQQLENKTIKQLTNICEEVLNELEKEL